MQKSMLNLSGRLPAGTAIGRFTVGQWLASGGTADIYSCFPSSERADVQRQEAHHYVVKLFRFQGDLDQYDRRIRLFEKEITTLRGLAGNIHIIQVLEFGDFSEHPDDFPRPYCVLPRMSGGTLTNLVHQQNLTPEQTVNVTLGLVDALQFAHQRAVLHCDIKPDNVMLDDSMNPIWIDFGIAKEIDTRTDAVSVMSEVGNVAVGTAPYMSPEHFAGRHALCPQSDLWSVGVLMIRMLTRVYPFGMHFEQVRQRTLIQRWTSLGELPAFKDSGLPVEIPDTLAAVILKCLQVEIEHRYQTAASLKEDLMALQQHRVPGYAMPHEAETSGMESMTMEVTMSSPTEENMGTRTIEQTEAAKSKLLRWFGMGALVLGGSFLSTFLAAQYFFGRPQPADTQQLVGGTQRTTQTSGTSPNAAATGNPSSQQPTGSIPTAPTSNPATFRVTPNVTPPASGGVNPNNASTSASPSLRQPAPVSDAAPVQVTFVPKLNYDANQVEVNREKIDPREGIAKPFDLKSGQSITWRIVGNGMWSGKDITGNVYANRFQIPNGVRKLRINWITGEIKAE